MVDAAGALPRRPRPALHLAVVHDTNGPRVRWGVLWFGAVVLAAVAARNLLAVVMAVAAGLAAEQVVRLRADDQAAAAGRRPRGLLADPRRFPAVLGGAALPLAAAAGADTLTAALPAVVLVVLAQRLCTAGLQPPPAAAAADVALSTVAVLALGLAAAGPVLLHGLAPAAAVVVLLLVSVYDAGDYVVGSGAPTAWEGPAAGVVAVAVATFAVSLVPLDPLGQTDVYALGGLVCVLAPLGPFAGSVLTGDGRRPARFLRRLDSLLILGPLLPYASAVLLHP